MRGKESIKNIRLPKDVLQILNRCPSLKIFENTNELLNHSCGSAEADFFDVVYKLPDGRSIKEATVSKVRNGISVNYIEPYMRRRDPESMVIADDLPTDKPRFNQIFNKEFDSVREETFEWLAGQDLGLFFFEAGREGLGLYSLAVVPANAAFFAFGLALLQGIKPVEELPNGIDFRIFLYVAPPFRHTHFSGRQIVVHSRSDQKHEIFSYNLYPGPSAKKGIYGTLIRQGEEEGWVAAHCSTVQVITPYDNLVTIMHEGASGGGKSEMLEQPHRLPDGRLLKGRNIITGEERYVEIPRTCDLRPVCDDMALCHPTLQRNDGRLWLVDAEKAWFVRVNHITEYGTDPNLEKLTAIPAFPLLFLNIDAVPKGRALIWEHIEDEAGKRCPNPRVVIPRSIIPNIINHEVAVDIRSIGIRTPPCTREHPTYGIVGLFHLLPPALAWLWRLVAPRGYSNPSIVDSEQMSSEGVGSYWPFATGEKIKQANLLLEQIEKTPKTRYVLTPNQYIGVWETGFMPQWLMRDYLARKGIARFNKEQIKPARCPLLGYALQSMRIEGTSVSPWFLKVETQPEVGTEGYDAGAKILYDFFGTHLEQFLKDDLMPLGRKIIECCLDKGTTNDYEKFFLESRTYLFEDEYF